MKKSYVLAAILAVAVGGWILSGQLGTEAPGKVETASPPAGVQAEPEAAPPPQVRVKNLVGELRANQLVILGRTEASRKVQLKAETSGRIVAIEAREGERIKKGAVIARIAQNDRQAKLREARALVKQRRIEFQAAKDLSARNFRSKTKLAEAEALLDAAKAYERGIIVDIAHTAIRAPFDGILDDRPVEVGNFLDIGDPVAMVVDLSPVLVVGSVTEQQVPNVTVGAPATAKLVTGQEVSGTIRFVASVARETTRTFTVELEAPNEDGNVISGITAEMRLVLDSTLAHFVSPAILTLSEEGEVGIKAVDADNLVRFYPVKVIADSERGVWLAGLPERLTVITVGQEFVQEGQLVAPVADGSVPVSNLEGRKS